MTRLANKTRLAMMGPIAFLAVPILAPLPAAAQAQTGTGGGPASTVTAPHTSAVGRTMPPGTGAGSATADDRRARTPQEAADDRVARGICIGCSPK